MEVLYMLRKIPTCLLSSVGVQICICYYIFVGFNHIYMVITRPSNGIGWSFLSIVDLAIILCKTLLHWYT